MDPVARPKGYARCDHTTSGASCWQDFSGRDRLRLGGIQNPGRSD